MQIVIEIPESVYENTKRYGLNKVWKDTEIIEEAIINGTPLPKNHGRLIDADDLEHITICSKTRNSGITRIEAPTIIEADNAESEK